MCFSEACEVSAASHHSHDHHDRLDCHLLRQKEVMAGHMGHVMSTGKMGGRGPVSSQAL